MAVKTSPRRTRSSFKKQNGTFTTMRTTINLRRKDGVTEFEERRRRGGGLGYLHNDCPCRSCKGSRGAF